MSSDAHKKSASIGRRMGMAAVLLSGSILLSRILGFLREAVIAYMYGASGSTDAYYAAFTLPDLMNYFLAGGTLSVTFIPMFSAYVARDDVDGGWRLFSTVATTMGSILFVFTIVFELLAPWVVPKLVPGFSDPAQVALAVRMTRIVIPAQLCFYVGGMLQATLFVGEVFWPAAIAPLIYNLAIIVGGVALGPWIGIEGFSVGVMVGAVLGPLALPLFASRHNAKFTPRFALHDAGFQKFVKLTLPLMLGVGLVTVDEWLLKYFGSSHEGAIVWLNNSRKLMLVVFALIGQAAGQAALPFLTRLHHEGKEEQMGEMLAESLGRVLFLSLVGSAALIVAAQPIVWVVFRRGAFSGVDATSTATLLVLFSFGLAAWCVQTMAVRGFYARENTLTPMLVATGVVVVAVPIYIILDERMGVLGLALATSIGMGLNALATVVVYQVRVGNLRLGLVGGGLLRGVLVGGVCAAAAFGARLGYRTFVVPTDFWTYLGLLVLEGAAFGIVLLAIAWVASPPELEFAVARLRRRFKRT